jgi:dienelactone hydrolase
MILKRSLLGCGLFLTAFVSHLAVEADSSSPRLDRENLLQYHRPDGSIAQGKTIRDWERRRAEILRGMQEVMGPLPGSNKKCSLDVRIEEDVDCGSYRRRLITYQSEPDSRVPAYLLIPNAALSGRKKYPAILALHPTDAKLGHRVVVMAGGKPRRNYGQELAERGYVVIAPPYPLLADYNPDLKALGYQSGTMKAIWDNKRAMDVLDTLRFVKHRRYGAIGHSLGGHNSVYTAVFDQRIKVIVSSSGLDSYLDYMDGNIKGWTSERYMPRLLSYKLPEIPFDFHEMVGALAPRPCFVNAPKEDTNFKWQSVDRVAAAAGTIYQLYGVGDHLHIEHPDCAHDFPDEMREIAYRLFDNYLK